jgi:hypothetical protein
VKLWITREDLEGDRRRLLEVVDPDMARAGWEELQPLVRLEKTVPNIPEDFLKISGLEMVWYRRSQLSGGAGVFLLGEL